MGGYTVRVTVLVKATRDSEAGTMPPAELLEAMGEYNEDAEREARLREKTSGR